MASPTVVGTPTESNATLDDTSPFTVSRPAGVSGQLTIVIIGADGQPVLTWPGGYTEFANLTRLANFTLYAAYHWEDGTEGTTFDITSGAAEKWAAVVYSISGAANPATRAPEATTVQNAATLNPDPPSITPTGGSKDYLFLAAFIQDGEEADDDTWCTAAPASYTNLRQKTTDVAGVAGTNTSLATAQRALTAASENPGTFTVVQSLGYVAATIAVHPPAAGAGALAFPTRGIYVPRRPGWWS